MKKLFLLMIAGAFILGCSNQSTKPETVETQESDAVNELVFENDLENALGGIPGWSNEKAVIKMPEGLSAHSGTFVTKIDNLNKYSYAFKEYFENINERLPREVVISGWVYSTDKNPQLSIVMDINQDNETIFWKGYNLMDKPRELNSWFEFKTTFTIDQPIKPSNQIKVFAFNAEKAAYFDDLKITFVF